MLVARGCFGSIHNGIAEGFSTEIVHFATSFLKTAPQDNSRMDSLAHVGCPVWDQQTCAGKEVPLAGAASLLTGKFRSST